jgi:cbb3-type cytochrome oxidase maturation protein
VPIGGSRFLPHRAVRASLRTIYKPRAHSSASPRHARDLACPLHRDGDVIPSSLAVVVAVLVLGASALALFAWAWRAGQLDDLDAQARAVLEPRDLRVERPWETPQQRRDRLAHGEPEPAAPGEWGGAA